MRAKQVSVNKAKLVTYQSCRLAFKSQVECISVLCPIFALILSIVLQRVSNAALNFDLAV